MTRFLTYSFLTFILTISITSCTDGPDDRTAYLSSLTLSSINIEIVDEVEVITDMQFDAALEPEFDPRTLAYTAKASCFTGSLDVLPFAAYPGTDISVSHLGGIESPETSVTPVNVLTPNNAITNFAIELSGDSYITTTYDVKVTRGNQNDTPAAPAIKLNGDYEINHTLGADYNDEGAKACDDTDTDISDQIITVVDEDFDKDTLGTYFITYDVNDGTQDATQITRTVNVVTNTAPVITLLGNASETVIQNTTYIDAGATALDAQEDDLSAIIDTNGTLDEVETSTIGATFEITYDVTDVGGLKAIQVIRTVEVVAAP